MVEIAKFFKTVKKTVNDAKSSFDQEIKIQELKEDAKKYKESIAKTTETVRKKLTHYDVQLIGGMALHDGRIAEMRTGEGKTLVATLAVVLNALSGEGVHLITVNDYLAKRDAAWIAPIYNFLGLSVGVIYPYMPPEERYDAYIYVRAGG